jgi:hypothetical protein
LEVKATAVVVFVEGELRRGCELGGIIYIRRCISSPRRWIIYCWAVSDWVAKEPSRGRVRFVVAFFFAFS